MKNLVASLALSTVMLVTTASAFIAGPYTADQYTIHLWHLDEAATPCLDSVPSGVAHMVYLTGGAALGVPSFSNGTNFFNNSLNTAPGGPLKGDLLAPVTGAGNFTMTIADTVTGAFTYEAVVQIGFDPTVNSTAIYEILSGESGTTANRIFQWRIVPKGFTLATGIVSAQPYMTFENIRAGSASQGTIYAPIPNSGPDAIVSNGWYHVAVTYSGSPGVAGNLIMYWTPMDGSRTAADALTINSATTTLTGLNPLATVTTPFLIGNQARNKNANFLGLIDEVRLSKVARSASGMMFSLPTVNLTPLNSGFVAVGSTLTLSSFGSGGLPIGYQWKFNGTNITAGTAPNISGYNTNTLVISNITFAESGVYTLVASNSSSTTNVSATITVGSPVPGLFNTGLTATGAPQLGGLPDANWQLVVSADPTYTGPAAYVDSSIPVTYVPNSASSQWIAPGDNISTAGGLYEYQTSFVLDSQNTTNMALTVSWGADNVCTNLILNGNTIVNSNNNSYVGLAPTVITNYFVPGTNVLICIISNAFSGGINLSAFRAELSALSAPQPPTPLQILYGPANISVYEYQNASLAVTAYGSGPITYQWFFGTNLLVGQTSRVLTIPNVSPAQGGTYSVTVANSLSTNSVSGTLAVIVPDTLEWQGATADWDYTSMNWLDTNTASVVAFSSNVNVLFDNAGSGQPNVSLDTALAPNSITVAASSTYTFGGGGTLAGNLNLVQQGPGTLVMDNTSANTYSGNTIIQGGTLQVGNSDGNGTLGASAVSNNASLVFTTPSTQTVPNSISGTGTITMSGSGTVLLTGNNGGFKGGSVVATGTLTPRNSSALGTGTVGTTVQDGAQLFVDANIDLPTQPLILGGVGTGNGAFHKGGAGTTTLGGPITLTDYAGIGLDGSSILNITNTISSGGNSFAMQLAASAASTISGPINLGGGSFTEYGPATGTCTVTMTSTNNVWTGGTTINANCVLAIGDGGPDGSIGNGPISDGGTLTFNTANNFTEMPVSGGGIFNQSGPGTMLFSGNPLSGFTGQIHINGNGQLKLAPGDSLTSAGILMIGAGQADTCSLVLTGNNTVAMTISNFPRAYLGTIGNNQPTTNYPNIVNQSGTNVVNSTLPVSISSGGNLFTLESDSGYLTYSGGILGNGAARNLALQGAGNGEVDGAITTSAGQSINVWMLGSGLWYLNGNSAYAGSTVVSNGTLVVNGSITSNAVTAWGGKLGGTGTLGGAVTIASGATLAPTRATGSSIGVLTVNNNLTLQAGSTTAMQVNKNTMGSDQVSGVTNLVLGGTLDVINAGGTLAAGDSFQLFSAQNISGAFSGITAASPGPGLRWNYAGVSVGGILRVTSTTPAAPTIATTSISGGTLTLTGSGGSIGDTYIVLTSTNVSKPLAQWTKAGSGAFDNTGHFSISTSTSAGAANFYALVTQ